MKLKSVAFAAMLALGVVGANADDLGDLNPSASFSSTVLGGFTHEWSFNLGTPAIVAASITNVEVTFGSFVAGGIIDFTATLNGTPLLEGGTFTSNNPPVTVTTQLITGSSNLPAGTYKLVVSGSGITGASASYGGNIVAAPIPEPETYAMMLAGLGAIGFLAARRRRRG